MTLNFAAVFAISITVIIIIIKQTDMTEAILSNLFRFVRPNRVEIDV